MQSSNIFWACNITIWLSTFHKKLTAILKLNIIYIEMSAILRPFSRITLCGSCALLEPKSKTAIITSMSVSTTVRDIQCVAFIPTSILNNWEDDYVLREYTVILKGIQVSSEMSREMSLEMGQDVPGNKKDLFVSLFLAVPGFNLAHK